MELNDRDHALISALSEGLPLVSHPYRAVGAGLGMEEAEVIARIRAMRESGIIRRFGIIVRHHELGFTANAMSVWSIPDEEVSEVGRRLGDAPEVTLCYRRPPRLPGWPYNLFCMIHGRDRNAVEESIQSLVRRFDLIRYPHAVLFSIRRFKQTGARYGRPIPQAAAE